MTDSPAQDAGIRATLHATSTPVRAILLGIFVSQLGGFLQTFLVLFLTHRGFTKLQAGTALGCYGVGAVLGVLIGGALADRLGAQIATVVSMGGSGALLVAVLYVHNYPTLLGTIGLTAVVTQLYRPASAALLSDLTPKHQRVMIFAVYRLALNLGTTIAPLVAVALISISWDLLFWADASTNVAYAVIAAIALPRRKIVREAKPSEATVGSPERRADYRAVFADRRYVLYLGAMFLRSAAYIQFVTTMPLVMKDDGLATAWFGVMITLNGSIVLTSELLVTKLVQRWPPRVAATTSFVLLGAGLTVIAPTLGLFVFFAATVLGTFSEIVGGPTLFSYPGLAAPKGVTARYMAAMQTAYGLGSAVGPAVGVAVWNLIGHQAWWLWGLICLGSAALAWSGVRPTTAEEPAPVTGAPDDGPGSSEPAPIPANG